MRTLFGSALIVVLLSWGTSTLLANDWSDWNGFPCCNGWENDWQRQISLVTTSTCERVEWRVRAVSRDDLLAELSSIDVTCRSGVTEHLTGPDFHTKLASFADIPVGETRSFRTSCLCRGEGGVAEATWEDEVDWNMPTPDDYPY